MFFFFMIQFMPNYWMILFLMNLMIFYLNYLNLYYYKKIKL